MTYMQVNKSGQENYMNTNHRMVPSCEYWVTSEPDTSTEILHRKKVIEDGVVFVYESNMLDSDDIRKFTTSLLTCIPLTSAFKPRGRNSYCPLSKQM